MFANFCGVASPTIVHFTPPRSLRQSLKAMLAISSYKLAQTVVFTPLARILYRHNESVGKINDLTLYKYLI